MAEAQETQTTRLRDQRNRFVAFAFAGADLVLEINADHTVAYAAGVSEAFCGLAPQMLKGQPVVDFVIPSDRPTLTEALRRIDGGGRFDSLRLSFRPGDGESLEAIVSGINLTPAVASLHLSVSRLKGPVHAADFRFPPGRLVEPDDFVAMVEQRIKEGEIWSEDYHLTLLDIPDAPGLSPQCTDDFLNTVEGFLRAHSVGGTSVGRLHDAKFGVVSDGALDTASMQRRIDDIAREIAPEAPRPRVHAASLDIVQQPLSAQELTRALVYTINRFIAEGGEKLTFTSLADGYRAALDDTLQRVAHFRTVIGSEQLTFVYQPIIQFESWTTHHYEALARIRQNGQIYLPSSFISFAEDVGVVNELDMVVCKRTIEQLRNNELIASRDRLAINLSGRSVSSSGFLDPFFRLLDANRDLMPRLLLELTESSEIRNLSEANEVLTKLRAMGCQTCLDDFGAGAAAFQYLRALEVDFVKIDGSYILDAFDTHYGLPFLRAISMLCSDMNIKCIAEMIEDEPTLQLVQDVGIGFGQGYHFCRPLENVASFVIPPRVCSQSDQSGGRSA